METYSFRHFVVIRSSGEKHIAVCARDTPKLTLVTTSVWGGRLHLDAPDMETLSLPFHLEENTGNKIYNIE